MRSRSLLVGAGAVLLIGTSVGWALAASRSYDGQSVERINRQATAWNTAAVVSTPDRTWQDVNWAQIPNSPVQPGPTPITVGADGNISVTFSANFTVGPVEVRALDMGHHMHPGVARFDPSVRNASVTYTFVLAGGPPRLRPPNTGAMARCNKVSRNPASCGCNRHLPSGRD